RPRPDRRPARGRPGPRRTAHRADRPRLPDPMRPLNIPVLVLICVVGAGFGAQMLQALAARGHSLPISGWLTTLVLLALSGVLLYFGVPLRRYMSESEERERHPTVA